MEPTNSPLPQELTEEERQRSLAMLDELRAIQAELLSQRGGDLFCDSVEILEEIRKQRDDELRGASRMMGKNEG
jgi:hypothetical protein